jgi:hypothetical protein
MTPLPHFDPVTEKNRIVTFLKDVIKKMLEKHGPMTKEEIVQKVMKERYVKENTILVNLQNTKHFKKDKEGKYTLTETK